MPTRRELGRAGLAALSLMAGITRVHAAAYPDRTIKLVVGFPAGQSSDAAARRVAQNLSEILKQTVYVDNRPGAAGLISHEAVKNSPADGYTLLMGSTGTLAINPSLYRKLPYDPARDFEPVALFAASPLVLFAPAAAPVNNVKEFLAHVKARPGKLTYGTGGSGTTSHIAMEMLKKTADIDLLHVPYKGSPQMITDLIGGQIDFAFEPAGAVIPFAKNGRIKLLGIATAGRFNLLPELPTLAEQGVALEATPWTAIVVPKGTPPAVQQQLNEAINAALKNPATIEEFGRTGSYALGGSISGARKFIDDEAARWGKAVKASGAVAE